MTLRLLPFALAVSLAAWQNAPVALAERPDASRDRVAATSGDAERMSEAVAEARRTLPGFLRTAEAQPHDAEGYALQVRVEDSQGVEHLWVEDFRRNEIGFVGRISTVPETVRKVRFGQTYTFSTDEISDWMYSRNGKVHGAYTIRARLHGLPPEEAEIFRRMLTPQ